jgi:hypothetical protein
MSHRDIASCSATTSACLRDKLSWILIGAEKQQLVVIWLHIEIDNAWSHKPVQSPLLPSCADVETENLNPSLVQ